MAHKASSSELIWLSSLLCEVDWYTSPHGIRRREAHIGTLTFDLQTVSAGRLGCQVEWLDG